MACIRPFVRCLACLFGLLPVLCAWAGPTNIFTIRVVDEQTGRGVPLVELRTVNKISYWTDSAGVAAIDDQSFIGIETHFTVSGHGYEYPKDGFGYRGKALRVVPGGSAEIKIKRLNVAERLYRITGAGIYRDSLMAGFSVPLKNPLNAGLVMGQDTVIATPYQGKLYWCYGDTDRPGYPLGNYSGSGAWSEQPGRGGLDPAVGIDLHYFTDPSGFCKHLCPEPDQGLKWVESLMVVADDKGRERLATRYAVMKDLGFANEWALALFNDEKQVFEPMARFDSHQPHCAAHVFDVSVGANRYFYLYPTLRVRANLGDLANTNAWESFTCLVSNKSGDTKNPALDRRPDGQLNYAWRAGMNAFIPDLQNALVKSKAIQRSENWFWLHDIEEGKAIPASPIGGSVAWNELRQRWILFTGGAPGEVWYAEGDTPAGPWVYARKVVTHDKYNFYNPVHHSFLDQEGGRIVYFEGTYTTSFSSAPAPTPRYEYNQIMYRLTLDDPRLSLPVPVYRGTNAEGKNHFWTRQEAEKESAWDRIDGADFFAMPPSCKGDGLIPIYAAARPQGMTLSRNIPPDLNTPPPVLFRAWPADYIPPQNPVDGVWDCRATRTEGSPLQFLVTFKLAGQNVEAQFDPNSQLRDADVRAATFKDSRLEMDVIGAGKNYVASALVQDKQFKGEWKQVDGNEHGTWSAKRAFDVPLIASTPMVVPLYEYRCASDNAARYSVNPQLDDAGWKRSAEPLCRVWRNPMTRTVMDPSARTWKLK